ncbi:MAG TPA: OpgC domain-containing protein [bacterium]
MAQTVRDDLIDFLRGLAICDMVLVHYARYGPRLLNKVVVYHDSALEGFLLCSGYSVGVYVRTVYLKSSGTATRTLLTQALRLVSVQYLLIVTASLPNWLVRESSTQGSEIVRFLARSVLFQNQIGLMHILPLFVPLFLASPILLALEKRWHFGPILVISALLFVWGSERPIVYGDPAIFPVLLWQTYFVIGFGVGVWATRVAKTIPWSSHKTPFHAFGVLMLALAIRHLRVAPHLVEWKSLSASLGEFSRFPLNVTGLLYGCAVWFFVAAIASWAWSVISEYSATKAVALAGRYSLLVFFIHVLFLKYLELFRLRLDDGNSYLAYSWFAANCLATLLLLYWYESRGRSVAGGIFAWLFGKPKMPRMAP